MIIIIIRQPNETELKICLLFGLQKTAADSAKESHMNWQLSK